MSRPSDLVLVGSAAQVRAGIRRYFDAGATEVGVTQTDLLGADTQRETIAALG